LSQRITIVVKSQLMMVTSIVNRWLRADGYPNNA